MGVTAPDDVVGQTDIVHVQRRTDRPDLRVDERQVVEVEEVLHHQFPVHGDVEPALLGQLDAVEVDVVPSRQDRREHGGEIGIDLVRSAGLGALECQIDEDHARPHLAGDRQQAQVLGAVGYGARALPGEIRCGVQSSVHVVGPAVVRALNPLANLHRLVGHGHATVSAGVVEHPDLVVVAADDQKGLAADVHRMHHPWFVDPVRVTGPHPAGREDPLLLECVFGATAVGARRDERVPGGVRGQWARQNLVAGGGDRVRTVCGHQ